MRSDNQGLLDISSLRWPGDKNAKAKVLETNAIVRLVHGMDNLTGRHGQKKMLSNDENCPMQAKSASGNPHGTIFCHPELSRDDGNIGPLKLVRIRESSEINIGATYPRNQRCDAARLSV